MNRYSAAEARRQMARVLDEVEGGKGVVIERKGVRFRVVLEVTPPRPSRPASPQLEILDADVEAGKWSWDVGGKHGVKFVRSSDKRP